MVFLVFALAVHALLFLGVSFGVSLNPVPRLADTLDVVLVPVSYTHLTLPTTGIRCRSRRSPSH